MFCEILKKYESTNTSFGTDKNTIHSYGDIYERVFEPYKDSASKILEIGFDCGASLQAYSDYFTNATIYGIDIKDARNESVKQNKKVLTHIGDATLPDTINHFPYEFDVIIEDGSHLPEHQIQHFKDYNKFVKPGGIYIIEDIHQDHFEKVKREVKQDGFSMEVYDLRPIKGRFDDILILLKKAA